MGREWAALAVMLVASLQGCAPSSGPAGQCGPVEHPQIQDGGHLLGDREPPVPYSSAPPTSGWHASGTPRLGITPEPGSLSEPQQVNVLEGGGVVISYRDLSPDELDTLGSLVRDFPDQVALTSYAKLEPHQVALTAWGTVQYCDGVDVDATRSFIQDHAGNTAHAH